MKNYLFALLIGLFAACTTENEMSADMVADKLELSKKDLKINNVEGSFTIEVIASGEWMAAVDETAAGWIRLSKDKGTGNGELRLFFSDNTKGEKRIGKVKVSLSGNSTSIEQELTVEQLGSEPDILFEYDGNPISFRGGDITLKVVSNIEWNMTKDESCTWLSFKENTPESRSFASDELILEVEKNTGDVRSAELKFTAIGDYVLQKTLEITQEAVSGVATLAYDEYSVPYKCKSLVIPFTQDGTDEFDAIPSESWITHDKNNSDETQIVLSLEDNMDNMPRTATVRILDKTVTIFQYGKPDTSIGDDKSVTALAFPGAEGGGRMTTGGRGGAIYKVTSLEDYNEGETPIEGTLRYGIEEISGARNIIFEVGGYIDLKRPIYLSDCPHLSIWGQTAPGDGITIRGYNFSFNLNRGDVLVGDNGSLNVILRFLRFRPGDTHPDYGEDAIGGRYFKDAIIDHITAGWSVDETLTFYGVKNFTAQWCIASESLNISNHAKGPHGYGAMFSGDNASFHHILLAHHGSRCPRISDLSAPEDRGPYDYSGYFDVRNNVYYNWSDGGFGCYGGKYAEFNITDCYYKPGPATGTGYKSYRVLSTDPTARAYINGNYIEGNSKVTADNWTDGVWAQFDKSIVAEGVSDEEKQAMRMADYQPYSKVTTHTPQDAYENVLDYAGASLKRDAIDERIVHEVRTGTAPHFGSKESYYDEEYNLVTVEEHKPGIIDTPTDAGGYPELKSGYVWPDADNDGIPDIWEIAYGLNPEKADDAKQISTDVDPNGRYSNLEVYLHNLVQHIVYLQNQRGTQMEKK